jgi:hypothetical protein
MQARIHNHIRSNIVGYVALFFALSGGAAWATHPGGLNTISSDDIINGAVKSADVGNESLESQDVKNDTFASGGLQSADLRPGSVGGSEVADGSLTGADIQESSLGQVPSAALGGVGRHASAGTCDPESPTFITCASITLNLPAPARVLVIGRVRPIEETDVTIGYGQCRLGTSITGGVFGSAANMFAGHDGGYGKFHPAGGTGDTATLSTVSPVVGPGAVSFGIDCNQFTQQGDGAIRYFEPQITAVAISPN